MNLKEITKQVCELTHKVGKFIQTEAKTFDIQHSALEKNHNELVSFVDREAEKQLVEGLKNILPDASFITEEETIAREDADWTWVIDPLDGTTNFMHRLPLYAISIALMNRKKEAVLGVVHELNRDECFHAYTGGGAFMNEEKINISKAEKISDSLIVTGFPYTMDTRADMYMKVVRDFQLTSHGVRRLGSAATDMAYVACGRLDGYFEFNVKIWDVAAGVCILKEAGGKTTDFRGNPNLDKISGIEVVAAGHIHTEMINLIAKHW
ncbi:MAG: inositol monophosphatase family protein [Cytophagales bacterium]